MARQLAVCTMVVVAFALCVAWRPGPGSAADDGEKCPVTAPQPNHPSSSAFGAASFNYGNARIRVEIWPRGQLVAGRLRDGGSMATVSKDGAIHAKVGWWRGLPGKLVIEGRRLDGSAPPLRADVPPAASYGDVGFIPSELTFPTVGCWRVTGEQGGASLTFVVKVTKARRNG